MEIKKIERIEGTKYVKIGDSVFNTEKDEKSLKTVCECLFCGERYGSDISGKCAMYCKNCKTLKGRQELTEANNKIFKETGLVWRT